MPATENLHKTGREQGAANGASAVVWIRSPRKNFWLRGKFSTARMSHEKSEVRLKR